MDNSRSVTITPVETEDQLAALNKWAAEFDHKIQSLLWPTFEVRHKGELVAYVQLPNIPVIYPAIHPKSSKRTVFESGLAVIKAIKSKFGICQAATPDESKFSPAVMKHFGFDPNPRKLYTHS